MEINDKIKDILSEYERFKDLDGMANIYYSKYLENPGCDQESIKIARHVLIEIADEFNKIDEFKAKCLRVSVDASYIFNKNKSTYQYYKIMPKFLTTNPIYNSYYTIFKITMDLNTGLTHNEKVAEIELAPGRIIRLGDLDDFNKVCEHYKL